MGFSYSIPGTTALRQGEIIRNFVEQSVVVSDECSAGEVAVESIQHPYVVVVTPDCDLEWDYKSRTGTAELHKQLLYVRFCALFPRDEIRQQRGLVSDLFRDATRNQHPRYHHFPEATPEGLTEVVPELFADFKYVFSMPRDYVYASLQTTATSRLCLLVCPYLQDFIQRLSSFLGRVGIAEAQD